MTGTVTPFDADLHTRLPTALHHIGSPSAWARMTRPGETMHSFLEGIVFDDNDCMWLADVPYGRIFKVNPAGTWTLVHADDGEPHSLRPLADGRFAVVDYSKGLQAFDPKSNRLEPLATDFNGRPFLGLSDLTVSSKGDIWFTDSGRTSLSDPRGALYCRQADGKLSCLLEMIPYPNGVVLSPGEDLVYVAVTRANAVWRLKTNGAETPPMVGLYVQLSGGLGPDGLAMSHNGFLAVAHAQAGRALVFDPRGDMIAEIRTPLGTTTTSVAFDRHNNLYIVEAQSGSVYKSPPTQWRSQCPK